ncbi:aminodeoxychorismate synthase component I [Gracilibacillus caseinilyticus]|uniref:Aminodeoxychorismate synthase component I n=1 Tax=Gracilibacillus caseinilyticus TaxID=2932256 RepID=A0ABY4EVW4_9BACI|nr:aminodeoxychorismate synthase component I [Gracilibacillus caseinilyticus]UOQ48196.1 aminodeoxychorismate synthase component I [Gracilibacillus caseinilyticus]
MTQPLLQFNFDHDVQQFIDPVQIWKTDNIHQIHRIFQEIEAYLNNGYYIAGFVSYEAAPAFDPAYEVNTDHKLPLVWFAAYDKMVNDQEIVAEQSLQYLSDWHNTTDFQQYHKHINQIKNAIAEGNTYQVNYTTRLEATFNGSAYHYYQQLLANQHASYSAFLDIGSQQILSVSPELFFAVENGVITTKPMKGTIKRGKTFEEDQHLKKALRHSKKDQAENVMIVDLLRNDLGRIAKPGTVQVKSLFDIETYPTVHQMTSTITAELETETIFEWFRALFPCGSITGAPKVETMKYIATLENTPREVYCGAIGWISPDRSATFNVPIRTVIINEGKATYGTGGGITWDSSSKGEYQELQHKAEILKQKREEISLIESLLLENGEFPLLEEHMSRLANSAQYFGFSFSENNVRTKLLALAAEYQSDTYKVRLLYHRNGEIKINSQVIATVQQPVSAIIAPFPVNKDEIYLYHKTTRRTTYDSISEHQPANAFTSLLWNKDRYVTEFTIGNVVIEKNGEFFTPPVSDGLLPGTFRQRLLQENRIKEKSILVDDLGDYDQVWFINSVRGWLKVTISDPF